MTGIVLIISFIFILSIAVLWNITPNSIVTLFGKLSLPKKLEEKFEDLEKENVECYKIPSSKNNKYSMLSAGMTILASFIEIEKKDYENLHWLDAKTAHNPPPIIAVKIARIIPGTPVTPL